MTMRRRWLISLIAALAVTALFGGGLIRRLDRWMQDWLFQRPGVTSGDIVIIGIDDEAFEALGPYNTWDRNIMASALEMLASDPDHLPAVTAIDVLYAGNSKEQADKRLAAAAADLGNVVTASIAEYGEEITWENGRAVAMNRSAVVNYEPPFEELRDVTTQGHINAMYDADGVMRHALLYVEPAEGRVYSMACETARIFSEQNGKDLDLPDVSHQGFFYIPYTAKPGNYYDGVSIARLLSGDVPAEYWAGKIVLIGPYAAALQDSYFTPIDKGSPMYGVEIQANVIQSLLEGDFKNEAPELVQVVVLFVLCLLAAERFLKIRLKNGGLLLAGLILLGTGGVFLLYKIGYVTHPLWLPAGTAVLFLMAVIFHYIRAAKERRALALEKERIGAELAVASRIQMNSLPKEFPPFPDRKEFDIYASMSPAKEVGGDLYDFFMVDEDHLGVFIGDVTGKGVPAALFM
ncbi:MAG: CHASE2 domain-containing protein, partial [Eubacterium sp.]|nr:CHASE2 domain-containing protein [Eubacterium sp.]